jgi:hypothetical protein
MAIHVEPQMLLCIPHHPHTEVSLISEKTNDIHYSKEAQSPPTDYIQMEAKTVKAKMKK